MTLGEAFPDQCSSMEGYSVFRSRLDDAVTRRDESAFRSLFADKGYARAFGISVRPVTVPWQISSDERAALWEDLDLILTLGCAAEDGRLFLPATAKVPEDFEATAQMLAVRATAIRSAPADDAPLLALAPRGALLKSYEYPENPKDGWEYFRLTDGRYGFAKAQDLRSALDTALVVVREGGEWRIEYYGGYD